jgi:hypothetical protein
MHCPVCGTDLHLELSTGDLVEPGADDRREAWHRVIDTAELREAERAVRPGDP